MLPAAGRLPAPGRLPRLCGSWPREGDERALSLLAAAAGHARWSACVVLAAGAARVITHGEHGGVRAAAAGPGTRLG
jgi:hypothetical protein